MTKTHKGLAYWQLHLEAIEREAISTSAYARQHGIALKRLYYWQRKSRAGSAASSPPSQAPAFVTMQIAKPMQVQMHAPCTLMLGLDIRLEMSVLPSPQWLLGLRDAAEGVR